jgi:hypothetical protein
MILIAIMVLMVSGCATIRPSEPVAIPVSKSSEWIEAGEQFTFFEVQEDGQLKYKGKGSAQ